jgi:hypothetical protein
MDQDTAKLILAKRLGYDPSAVIGNPQPPDPSWREMYPEQYFQLLADYNTAVRQKQAFETAYSSIVTLNAQSANNAVFEKARITNDLNDSEYQAVKQFALENMRPNQAGMYSDAQIQAAVKATVDRSASQKLETANKTQQILKRAAQGSPKKTVTTKQEPLSDEVKEARRFKEVAQSLSTYKPKKE